jgi:hypothetical protein
MAIIEPQVGPRRGAPLPGVTAPVRVCLIVIHRDDAGAPTGLEVTPTTPRECTVYYRSVDLGRSGVAPLAPPVNPREVVWVTNDLRANETILLEPKHPGFHPFLNHWFTITHPENFVSSGPVVATHLPAGRRPPYVWEYFVRLERADHEPLVLDPMLLIEEDR